MLGCNGAHKTAERCRRPYSFPDASIKMLFDAVPESGYGHLAAQRTRLLRPQLVKADTPRR